MQRLHPFQARAIAALADERAHVVCVAPTGSGKSLIYERHLAETARNGDRMLLVSPLIALARQQRQRLEAQGVSVHLSTGETSPGPPSRESRVWIASPETLASRRGRAALAHWKPDTLVVDECHCLWEWGERFRPAFRELPSLLETRGIRRSLWLTATLAPGPRRELLALLPDPRHEIGEFDLPPYLRLRVRRVPWAERAQALLAIARRRADRGIVFVSTRESAERVARLLVGALGPSAAAAYHGGLSSEERRALERSFAGGRFRILVATCAYGMGMDNAGLGWVALWQAPTSLLALAQMIGRTGRAGQAGYALVLWDPEDFVLNEWGLHSEQSREDFLALRRFLETADCRRNALRGWFSGRKSESQERCNSCDLCFPDLNSIN